MFYDLTLTVVGLISTSARLTRIEPPLIGGAATVPSPGGQRTAGEQPREVEQDGAAFRLNICLRKRHVQSHLVFHSLVGRADLRCRGQKRRSRPFASQQSFEGRRTGKAEFETGKCSLC